MNVKSLLPLWWVLFFATSVLGHVAMTIHARAGMPRGAAELARFVVAPWMLAVFACWGTSTALWLLLLERHGLAYASSVSSLRYVLILLASWSILQETLSARDVVGAVLITAGIACVATR